MSKVFLKPGKEKRVFSGHPWVFLSDIERADKSVMPGDLVGIFTKQGKYLAQGVYNPNSQIALRILTTKDEAVDKNFIKKRVERAISYRRKFADLQSCRLIHAEADGLPAIVVDSFGPVLSLQCLSLGMSQYQKVIVESLVEILSPMGIYERNDVPIRRLEGMEQSVGVLHGEIPDKVEMMENGIRFLIDVKHGQKTGYFLDQKENRAAIAPFVKGSEVLDCFTHTGSFALHAAKYGAESVLGIDISEFACQNAQENKHLNEFENVDFKTANAFDFLREESQAGKQFDVIVLDPPAFAKSKSNIASATKGYKEINLRAMKMIRDGGYLITCSCSQHILAAMFKNIVLQAANDAGVNLMQAEFRSQSKDHPVLPAAMETQYLKCGIYRITK
ncbi:MAG: class I SAM-dependent rRNA methyltransferase [Clostridiales bacterium]|nr:class I SAM-dependent rRNA methyltransferase [Clostridiales bacterium]